MKKGAPKYQNKIAFKMRYHDHYSERVQNAQLDKLCEPCTAQIEWKIKYGKYKTPHDLSRCTKCEKKNIFKAYRRLCDGCSDELKQCSKCMEQIEVKDDSSSGEEMEENLKCLRERSKRTILRRLEKEEISWDKHHKRFIENESGEQVIVQFKKDYIDEEDEEQWEDKDANKDDSDSNEDFSEDDEEKEKKKKNEKKVKIVKEKNEPKKAQPQKQQQKQKKQKDESSDDESDIDNLADDDIKPKKQSLKQEKREVISSGQPEVYSDGSKEQDHIQREEKNFKYYFCDDQKQEAQ